MRIHLKKAIALSQKVDAMPLSEEDDLFWALVKYAENVQECIVQLDNMSGSIFSRLIELPMKSKDGASWDDLKGMRSRLAHKFWDIDQTILWETVTKEFVQLNQLLESLMISKFVGDIEDQRSSRVDAQSFFGLQPAEAGARIGLGNSLPFLYFDSTGTAQCLRIGDLQTTTYCSPIRRLARSRSASASSVAVDGLPVARAYRDSRSVAPSNLVR